MELYAIVIPCTIWGDTRADKQVLFHCDNQAVTSVWDLELSHSADLIKYYVCSLFFIAALIKHILSSDKFHC